METRSLFLIQKPTGKKRKFLSWNSSGTSALCPKLADPVKCRIRRRFRRHPDRAGRSGFRIIIELKYSQTFSGLEKYSSVIQYNNENSLSSVLTIAYLSAMQFYFKPYGNFPQDEDLLTLYLFPNRNI